MRASITFRLSLFVLTSVLVMACKKGAITYQLNCHVTDSSAAAGLAGATATVKIFYTAGAGQNTETTFTTDNSGNFELAIERKKIEKVVISISKDGYFSTTRTFFLDELSVEDPNQIDFSTYAKAWVKLHFTGDGSFNYQYIREIGLENCDACFPNGLQTLNSVTDTSLYYINNGNTPFQLFWSIQGSAISGQENVITIAQDTTEILIAN
jgi:hypothetical protein